MNNSTHPLQKTAMKVLEEWGMMLAEEVSRPEAHFDSGAPLFLSWVEMKGTFEGTISVISQKTFLKTLAANLLGTSEDLITSDDEKDAFQEMGNVLAGNFLTEAYGTDLAFDVTTPHVTEVPFSELDQVSKRPVSFFFIADELPVAVTFSIREKV